jgi:hypothetical protein
MANRNVEIIQEIISELNALQNSKEPPDTRQVGPIPFPRLLSGKNNAQILVNKRIELLIQDLGRKTYNDALKVNHIATLEEWQRAIRSFFGDELTGAIDLTNEQVAAKTIRKKLFSYRKQKIEDAQQTEWAFPCTIFSEAKLDPFKIGPVRIETREDWLIRQIERGRISKVSKRRLERQWANGNSNRPRKATDESLFEGEISRTVKDHKFMITVELENLLPEAALKRANMLANLTLAAIACLWTNPSKALRNMFIAVDWTKTSITGMLISEKRYFPFYEPIRLPGNYIDQNLMYGFIDDNKEYWEGVTNIFNFLAMSRPDNVKKELHDILSQALMFFQRGCAETSDLMAMINLANALDILSKGVLVKEQADDNKSKGRVRGIVIMIQGLLGYKQDSNITRDGRTVYEIIDEIYSDARSRTVHGTSERYHLDWQELREIATYITHRCLTQAIGRAGELERATCMKHLFYEQQD